VPSALEMYMIIMCYINVHFTSHYIASTLLAGQQELHLACENSTPAVFKGVFGDFWGPMANSG